MYWPFIMKCPTLSSNISVLKCIVFNITRATQALCDQLDARYTSLVFYTIF